MLAFWVAMALLVALNLLLLPYFVFLMTVSLASIFGRRQKLEEAGNPRSRFAVVIPAHDEASGIAETLHSCLAADYPRSLFSVIVVADNCTDRTAAIAMEAGATVFERFDETKKSKGHALGYLFGILSETGELDSLDAVIIIDADSTIDPGLLLDFDRELNSGADWLQCYYTVADPDRTWRTGLMNYAFSLFNGVTLMGQNAVGLSAGFRGNGMCFSVRGLRRNPWRSYGLVEDMDYSWSIRIAGEHINFVPGTRVYGAMPGTLEAAAANQRRRWEFGRRDTCRKFIRPLLLSRKLAVWQKVASFLELTMPSLARLVMAYLLVISLNACAMAASVLYGGAIPHWPFVASSLFMTAAFGVYAISPFIALKVPWKSAGWLIFFPVFLGWKLLAVSKGRPREWVRTNREPRLQESDSAAIS
jgi:cellulose synthase/poly-beta-1,6-N-acetylglucosamine synthase-like glycosyltransferase